MLYGSLATLFHGFNGTIVEPAFRADALNDSAPVSCCLVAPSAVAHTSREESLQGLLEVASKHDKAAGERQGAARNAHRVGMPAMPGQRVPAIDTTARPVLTAERMKLLAFATLTLLAPPLLAQTPSAKEPASLALGSRLRVLADQEFVGRLIAQDEKSLTLEIKRRRARAVIPRSAIIRVERSLHTSKKGTGAATGALVGGLSAVVLGLLAGADCSGHGGYLCISSTGVAVITGMALVPLGAAIGAVVSPSERWEPISVSRFAVSLAPVRSHGISVSATLRF